MRAEYTSAAHAAQALHWAIQVGLPDDVHRTALRIVADELDHAALSHACLEDLGGGDAPLDLDVSRLQMPAPPEGPLAALVDAIVRNFCLGETFAVPLFDAMRRRTTHPRVLSVLERILRDEAVHRAFGWRALDALLDLDPQGVRARIAAHMPRWLAAFHRAYGEVPPGPPLTPEEEAVGLIPAAVYETVHAETLRDEIVPRMARRGIAWA